MTRVLCIYCDFAWKITKDYLFIAQEARLCELEAGKTNLCQVVLPAQCWTGPCV